MLLEIGRMPNDDLISLLKDFTYSDAPTDELLLDHVLVEDPQVEQALIKLITSRTTWKTIRFIGCHGNLGTVVETFLVGGHCEAMEMKGCERDAASNVLTVLGSENKRNVLKRLALEFVTFTEPMTQSLVNFLAGNAACELEELRLIECCFHDTFHELCCGIHRSNSIQRLEVSGCHVTDTMMVCLIHAISSGKVSNNITHLNLSNSLVRNQGIQALADWMSSFSGPTKLQYLDLSFQHVYDPLNWSPLWTSLCHVSQSLTYLDVSCNLLSENDIMSVASVVRCIGTLEHIYLCNRHGAHQRDSNYNTRNSRQRSMGLRRQEPVQQVQTMNGWIRAVHDNPNLQTVEVTVDASQPMLISLQQDLWYKTLWNQVYARSMLIHTDHNYIPHSLWPRYLERLHHHLSDATTNIQYKKKTTRKYVGTLLCTYPPKEVALTMVYSLLRQFPYLVSRQGHC